MYQNNANLTQEEFIAYHKKKKVMITFYRLLIFVVFFGIWELATQFKIIDSFIFSSPSRIIKTFISMTGDGSIFYHVGITLAETIVSFLLVLILGILIAVILWWNSSIASVIEPYLVVLNSLPKTALAPILIVWLGNNIKTIIVCAISLAIFTTIINLYTSFINVEEDKILLIKTLGGNKKDILLKVILPSSFSAIVSSMKVNIGLCLVGVIIGEFLAANAGLGYLIIYGSQVFKLDWVTMSIIILCFMATGLYKLIDIIFRKYV